MRRRYGIAGFLAVFILLVATTSSAFAESRHALVIGNSAYKNTSPLRNPENDAALMAERLEGVGFKVTRLINAGLTDMKKALTDFSKVLSEPDSVALFYYAGHGAQVSGENYLVPIDAKLDTESEVESQSVKAREILKAMERSPSRMNVVILDACRNNPFASRYRSATRGLARMDAPRGTYIAYATSPGDVALDGDGANSPYTSALSEAITLPGLTIEQVFKQARRKVLQSTRDRQTPWESSSITGEFYFVSRNRPGGASLPAPPAVSRVPKNIPPRPQSGVINKAPAKSRNCFTFNNQKICD